ADERRNRIAGTHLHGLYAQPFVFEEALVESNEDRSGGEEWQKPQTDDRTWRRARLALRCRVAGAPDDTHERQADRKRPFHTCASRPASRVLRRTGSFPCELQRGVSRRITSDDACFQVAAASRSPRDRTNPRT